MPLSLAWLSVGGLGAGSPLSCYKFFLEDLQSVDEIFLLTIRCNSGGNFVSSTGESIAPYDVGSTPRDLKLWRCDSVVLYGREDQT